MKCGSQIAVAVVGGYLLGRSRKTRLAALLALLAAGGRLPIDQRELLSKTPLGGPLEKLTGDLRSQLVDAGMSVAKKAASSRIDSLSDRLQQRADALREPGLREREEAAGAEEPVEEPTRRERRPSARGERRPEEAPRRERPRERERAEEPETYDEDEYDEYEDYEGDEYDRGGERADYDRDEYDRREYDRDEYEDEGYEDEEPPARERVSREERRPQARPARSRPRGRAPRREDREDEGPRRGRAPR